MFSQGSYSNGQSGDKRRAASCFWRAADAAGAPQEQLTWLRNAAQVLFHLGIIKKEKKNA
jgi:hypothetical protein